jgi:FG-GAP-like repeat/Transmembrane protein 131-like N-terminal/Abnormal spindle-like microcephaly-assoc'd, ASPM-SPD-2-Hydin
MIPSNALRLRWGFFGFAGLLFLLGACAPAWAQFETRSTFSVGNSPESIAVGDFNHDGRQDVAVATAGSYTIAVSLGNGDGTFKAPVFYTVGGVPTSIAAAPLTASGNLDLVVANALTSNISVLLGNGDGTFQAAKNANTSADPTFVCLGDFNGDHILDLVVADSPYVSVLLGNGDGTFRAPIDNSSLPTYIPGLAIGDFNGDGHLDVAAAAPNTGFVAVGILLGNGDGTLQAAVLRPVNFGLESVVAADFNGDGKLDLAFSGLGVLLGNGDGTFGPEVDYAGGGEYVSVAQLSPDGRVDLVTADFPSSSVSVFIGNGDGTFKPPITYPTGAEARFVAAADFNGDQQQDIVAADYLYGDLTVLLNTGVVSLSPTVPLTFPTQLVNTSSVAHSVRLTNTGTTALSISSISVKGQFHLGSSTTCAGRVAAGAECIIEVTFKPLTTGRKSGTVSINDSASSKPQVIELSGQGTVVSLSPSALNFPGQKVGTKSAPMLATVKNDGSAALTISSVSIGGNERKDFSETDNCASQTLAPGATCTVTVIFAPTKTGTRSATLFVDDNGGGSPQTLSLTGTGT